MPKKDYTAIVFVLDKSSSMIPKTEVVLSSFDEFVEGQKNQPGECTMTLVQFDTTYEIFFVNRPIAGVKPLKDLGYHPEGCTALWDAVARAVGESGASFARMKEEARPDNVVLVILTDGQENSSVEVTLNDVKGIIEHQVQKYNWKVVYLHQGLAEDARQQAGGMGISHASPSYFVGNMTLCSEGVSKGMKAAGYAISSSRCAGGTMDKVGTQSVLDEDEDSVVGSTSNE